MQLYPYPSYVLESNVKELAQVLHQKLNHVGKKKAKALATKLYYLAELACPAVDSDLPAIEHVREIAQELIRLSQTEHHFQEEMLVITRKMKGNDMQILQSLPGISKLSALHLIACIGDVRRFSTSNKLNAYVGIDLRKYESGRFIAARHISKIGNSLARKTLYNIVLDMASAAARSSSNQSHIIDFYNKRKRSSLDTKPKKIIIAKPIDYYEPFGSLLIKINSMIIKLHKSITNDFLI